MPSVSGQLIGAAAPPLTPPSTGRSMEVMARPGELLGEVSVSDHAAPADWSRGAYSLKRSRNQQLLVGGRV